MSNAVLNDGLAIVGLIKKRVQMRPNPVSVEPVKPFAAGSETTKTARPFSTISGNAVDNQVAEQWLNNLFTNPRIASPIAERNQASAEIQTRFQQEFSAVAGDKQK